MSERVTRSALRARRSLRAILSRRKAGAGQRRATRRGPARGTGRVDQDLGHLRQDRTLKTIADLFAPYLRTNSDDEIKVGVKGVILIMSSVFN